jgi:hypothetical protein
MRSRFIPLLVASLAACSDVPLDDQRDDQRLFPARGVIRGTVTYFGPRPCSRDGHIVGSAIVLVFDQKNPPPPTGLATSAVNFVAIPGDVLFANEPRSTEPEVSCPPEDPIEVSAPFAVAPLEGGRYVVAAFYDRRGRFWPTFKFRNLPEAGDIAGGYIDIEDAQRNATDPVYQPIYRTIEVGVGGVVDDRGFVADNVPVTIGRRVPFTRPYFHPRRLDPKTGAEVEGSEEIGDGEASAANPSGDPFAVPILSIEQDVHVLAPPSAPTPETLTAFQRSFPNLRLDWGVAEPEFDAAVDPLGAFGFQLPPPPPRGVGGLLVFARGGPIPDHPAVPALWPQIALVKLADDPTRRGDPQSLVVQGTPEETLVTGKRAGPLVVLQGITLDGDTLAATVAGPVASSPTTAALRDHLTAMLRPAVLCFDAGDVAAGGVLAAPHLTAASADPSEPGDKPIFDEASVAKSPLVREIDRGCLPKGRYAISLVYPTGQAWTVPNEAGGCSREEGSVVAGAAVGSCTTKPRPVLLSQGSRAVVEIVDAADARTCEDFPVPEACRTP